jgi:hypothetical protein
MRNHHLWLTLVIGVICLHAARGQQSPGIAYMNPPGGQAGQTLDVALGGYDWTPDMQVFVLDPRVKLEILAPPGPVIVPEPPYWFDRGGRRAFPLPRETRARLTIPSEMPVGIVRWQVVNANGASNASSFMVAHGTEIVEITDRKGPQQLASLPVTISGQITKIEEVDRFCFLPERNGLINCSVVTHAIESLLNAVIEVHDEKGQLVVDVADTEGQDPILTFYAETGCPYTVSIHDVDFRGNRAFVYRLSITNGPRLVAAIPPAGRRGETRTIKFVGYGVATGKAKLESITREVEFPADAQTESFPYQLETAYGTTPPLTLLLSDLEQTVEPSGKPARAHRLTMPGSVTGTIEGIFDKDHYLVDGKQGDVWALSLEAARLGSPLDVVLSILDPTGKELAHNDDLPETTDAGLQFTVPADGTYQIGVTDVSGKGGNRGATYRLVITRAVPNFALTLPELVNVPIGDKATLEVKVTNLAGFNEPITILVSDLPDGVTVEKDLSIPAGKNSLGIELTAATDSAVHASFATVTGAAKIGQTQVTHPAGKVLVAATLKPPFSIEGERRNSVTKWPRGSTFPAAVMIERSKGFDGEIVLEMSSAQSYHRQGIHGPELTVPPGVERILYPIFLPEWLQTSRTSRLIVNGVARVADPQGNIHYSVSRLKDRLGFMPVGALLKISGKVNELQVTPGDSFEIPLTIHRARQLVEPTRLELHCDEQLNGLFSADSVSVPAEQNSTRFRVVPASGSELTGNHKLTIRATILKERKYPVVSETSVLVSIASR